jgi:hypothetical protein
VGLEAWGVGFGIRVCRLWVAGCGSQVAGCRLRVAGCGSRVAGCGLRVAGCESMGQRTLRMSARASSDLMRAAVALSAATFRI